MPIGVEMLTDAALTQVDQVLICSKPDMLLPIPIYEGIGSVKQKALTPQRQYSALAVSARELQRGRVRDNPEVSKHVAGMVAFVPVGVPDDIGPMITALLSGESRSINGQGSRYPAVWHFNLQQVA